MMIFNKPLDTLAVIGMRYLFDNRFVIAVIDLSGNNVELITCEASCRSIGFESNQLNTTIFFTEPDNVSDKKGNGVFSFRSSIFKPKYLVTHHAVIKYIKSNLYKARSFSFDTKG